jgi:transposase
MTSMTRFAGSGESAVTGGVDCHAGAHHAAVLDRVGRLLGTAEFPATSAGYRQLRRWLDSFGVVGVVGVESTGSYGAALTRHLRGCGVEVVEVNQPHPHARARRGKSDAVDAEMAARKALSREVRTVPKDTTGIVESIRQLKVARSGAVKARTAALVQLGELLVTAPAQLREDLDAKTLPGKAAQCLRLRPDPARVAEPLHAAKTALRSIARRLNDLDTAIAELDTTLVPLVATAAPRTLALLGVGTQHAAQLLVTAGQNITRLRDDATFAHLCGADPVPASSGKTVRHRLNHGGDRAANSALHMIVVVRLRYCTRTRTYLARRTAEGKTKRETMRCLKRYLAREIYKTLTADLAHLAQPLDAL